MHEKYILILTKTLWNEPPRIRHQLTKLLIDNGYKIIFFEKTSHKYVKYKVEKYSDNLIFVRHYEPVHHQLKLPISCSINNFVIKKIIKKICGNYKIDFVINFNYDYDFLRKIFPDNKIITFINDDFVAQSKFYRRFYAKKLLMNTCKNSDVVLTVSYPLVEMLKKYNRNTNLFLPWAENKYKMPEIKTKKDTVLYWGYINNRIDWSVLIFLAQQGVQLNITGPTDKSSINMLKLLDNFQNVEINPATSFDKLNLDNICCSILPYNPNNKSDAITTVSNRAFNLLSRGIPLVHVDIPALIEAKNTVIRRCISKNDYLEAINFYKNNFFNVQDDIEEFLISHYPEQRIEQFKKISLL